MRPPKLVAGDRIRLVSPASPPERDHVYACAQMLGDWGLSVEIGAHAFDDYGYLAGRDDDRLADINAALRDPGVRAIMATRGGKGAYRLADRMDFDAARADPKLLIGFSEITILHLALFRATGLAGLHAASWTHAFSRISTASLRQALFTSDPVLLQQDRDQATSALTTKGAASGVLLGGNQDMIATAAGWALPRLEGAILMLEATGQGLGSLDRQLTMLRRGGHFTGLAGIAVGQYTKCGPRCDDAASAPGLRCFLDVLADHLRDFEGPVLGGLPFGHGDDPRAVPVGAMAVLDADAGTLEVEAAVS